MTIDTVMERYIHRPDLLPSSANIIRSGKCYRTFHNQNHTFIALSPSLSLSPPRSVPPSLPPSTHV